MGRSLSQQNPLFNRVIYNYRKAHLSSKKLLEQCQKLEKLWNHVFTATTTLANITAENQWYNKLTDLIDKQQTAPIWMSESKVSVIKGKFSSHILVKKQAAQKFHIILILSQL